MERTYNRGTPQPCKKCGEDTWCDQAICYRCYNPYGIGNTASHQSDPKRKVERVEGFTVITEPAS